MIRDTIGLLVVRDGYACGRCTRPVDVTLSGLHADGPTLGHVIPAIAGGGDGLSNLRLEHRRCNLAAGGRITPPQAKVIAPIRLA